MEFSASTWLWSSPFSNDEGGIFQTINALGFDSVELPLESLELIHGKLVKEVLGGEGLTATVCGASGPGRDLSSSDLQIVAKTLDCPKGSMDFYNEAGVSFLDGPMYAEARKVQQLPPDAREAEWNHAVDNLRMVSIEAASRGLEIAIEASSRSESGMVNKTEGGVRMIREINHSVANVMVDASHMTIEEANIGDAIPMAGEDLLYVQASENHRGVPGTGLTPWEGFRDARHEIQHKGVLQ